MDGACHSPSIFGSIPTTICHEGRTYVNFAKGFQKLFVLSTSLTVAANSVAQGTLTPPRDQGAEGDGEFFYVLAESTGQFALEFYSQELDRQFMSGPIESSLVCGHGNLPGRLLEPIYLPASTSLQVKATDLSGSGNTVRVTLIGHQLLAQQQHLLAPEVQAQLVAKQWIHPLWLTTQAGARVEVGAGAEVEHQLIVPSDAYFNCWGILARSDQGVDKFSLDILEGQRRSLFSAEASADGLVPVGQVAGQTLSVTGFPNGGLVPAASMPMLLPFTHLFEKNTVITVRLKDTSGSTNQISVGLGGQAIYYPSSGGALNHLNARQGPLPIQSAPAPLLGIQGYDPRMAGLFRRGA